MSDEPGRDDRVHRSSLIVHRSSHLSPSVVIDGRPLVGNRTGISVHTAEIARRLGSVPLIASHAEIADRSGLEHCSFRVDRMPLGVLWQQLMLPRIDGDVLWAPHGTLPLAWRRPSVVTVHDFTSLTMPGRHRLKTILSFNLFVARSLEQASRIACVSRAVADRAMRSFGVDAAKIEIVPNGVDDFFSPGGDESDYVLFTGTLEPRKGLADLLAVWRTLVPRPRLILCGDAGWGTKIASEPGLEMTGYVTRERLRELYRGARAFVYPSLYEGFGIPPLEAMACGAPVIATRTGAIPEFAGDAAVLIEPGDRVALRAALVRVLGEAGVREELRARGPARAALYRWDRSAELMNGLLESAR
ncbi:MAG TPA: glycosyltransferase family 1 protein [Thermoanaerobaculia bacterium]|jgi:glycosyltransferase involved in cell wall biosynthesis